MRVRMPITLAAALLLLVPATSRILRESSEAKDLVDVPERHVTGMIATSFGVALLSQVAPQVDVASVNPGTNAARGLCLAIAAGPGAAYECGDLRLAHALPAVRTMGQWRSPTLFYSSQQAAPYPIVASLVTQPSGATTPDSVTARLVVGGVEQARGRWSPWGANQTRRISLGYSASGTTSGFYGFTLEVRNWYGGSSYLTTRTGTLGIVNRGSSEFGSGWWIAGLERLLFSGSDLVWIGGDGSIRSYKPAGTNKWGADQLLDRPDTIRLSGSLYRRELRGGGEIQFDGTGRHVGTLNRLGHLTQFTYDGSGRLHRVLLHPAADSLYYQFTYTSGKLTQVTAPGIQLSSPRLVKVTQSSGKITKIEDPDTRTVQFAYTGNRVNSRTDRRGTVTTFAYNGGWRVTESRLDPSGLNIRTQFTPQETRGLGIQGSTVTAVTLGNAYTLLDGPRTDATDHVRFYVNRFGTPDSIRDPLANVTKLSRNNGAYPALVTKVTHPGGYQDSAQYNGRGNPTRLIQLNPYGNSANHTTRYEYYSDAARSDYVQRVVPPAGDSVVMNHLSNGNVEWQQDRRGSVSRAYFRYYSSTGLLRAVQQPNGAVDSLAYDGRGNLIYQRSPLGTITTRELDRLGRDTLVKAPSAVSEPVRSYAVHDVMNRIVQTRSVGPQITYSCTNCAGSSGKAVPQETLFTDYLYDEESNVWQVTRSVDPYEGGTDLQASSYSYDRANRKTMEQHGSGSQQFAYDAAGNLTAWTTRGKVITMEYDAANRLTSRVIPEVFYPELKCDGSWMFESPCIAGLNYDSLKIPQDVQTFAYDARGNLTAAHNRYARIGRTYFPGGAVRTDTLRLRTYGAPYIPNPGSGGGGGGGGGGQEPGCDPGGICIESTPLTPGGLDMGIMSGGGPPGDPYPSNEFIHVYGLGYTYDGNGRRTSLEYPSALKPGSQQSVAYTYHDWGPLSTVTGLMSDTYTYAYDVNTRIQSLTYPGSIVENFTHDADSRMVRRQLGPVSQPASFFNDTLTYYAHGRIKRVEMRSSAHVAEHWYSGLGHVVASRWNSSIHQDFGVDEFRSDAHGNQYWSRKYNPLAGWPIPTYQHEYAIGGAVSRIRFHTTPPFWGSGTEVRRDVSMLAGDVVVGTDVHLQEGTLINGMEPARNYYAADGKLRAVKKYRRSWDPYSGDPIVNAVKRDLIVEVRYDALGRRVIQHTRHRPQCDVNDCAHAIERYVWEGDQLLYELRADGGGSSLDTQWSSGRQYGRTGYVHGPGIDAPLAVMRSDFAGSGAIRIVPFTNWRGQYARGNLSGGWPECTGSNGPNCVFVDWPAPKLRTFYDGYPNPLGDWVGSLIQDQRDHTGLLYRRNRYYDPSTGQFTQEDPIGLAGGLNLYGFANGDPINFSDPFGLCPEDKRDENGNCPGGITVREWERVEYAANNHLTSEAGGRVLELLNAGKIHGAVLSRGNVAAQTNYDGSVTLNRSDQVGRSTFEYAANNLAFVMAHEAQHVEQFSGLGGILNKLSYGIGIRRGAMEADANAYACAHVKDKNSGYRSVCVGR